MEALNILFHSWLRWAIILVFFVNLYFIYFKYYTHKKYTKSDKYLSYASISLLHIQFLLGIYIYSNSVLVSSFFVSIKEYMKVPELRFFSIEHSIMMILAIVIITIGYSKAKRKLQDHEKFKTLLVYYTFGLILMLISIPWEFSPYIKRPLFIF